MKEWIAYKPNPGDPSSGPIVRTGSIQDGMLEPLREALVPWVVLEGAGGELTHEVVQGAIVVKEREE